MKSFLQIILLAFFIIPSVNAKDSQSGRGEGSGTRNFGTIKGQLIDQETENPLMYASAVLYRESDSVMVSGSISEDDGSFKITEVPPGKYYIEVQFVGYPTQKYNDIEISRDNPVYDAGIIKIAPSAEYLDEVLIEATREMMQVGLDRRVINVGQELTAIGGTALDLMQNIPAVNVDFDGNVSLRGSSNVTILLDGRPSELTGMDEDTILEQLPSEMIDRIEIITNPSVRYDPDGTAGIINIVTKREERPGYNGMINLSAGTNHRYSGSINFNYRVLDNLNLFTSISGRFFNMYGESESDRINWMNNGADTARIIQDSEFERSMDNYNIQLGFDYELNEQNTITFSARYNDWERNNLDKRNYIFENYDDLPDYRLADNTMMRDGFSYALNYRREYDEDFRELNVDFSYSDREFQRTEDNKSFFDYQKENDPDLMEFIDNISSSRNFNAEFDYSHPLNDNLKIETGWQTRLRTSDNDFRFYNVDVETGERLIDDRRTDLFEYNDQRHSAYAILSAGLGNYNVEGGLRAEQAVIEGSHFKLDGEEGIVDNDYFSLFPSAHVRRHFENDQDAQLSYSKRISRPRRWALNPFPRYSDPYNISMGNPNLLPEYIHSLELSYTKYWENTTINPSVFYRYTDQMMTRYRVVDEDDEKVTITSWDNIGHAVNYGVELVASQTVAPWWRINGNASYFKRMVEGDVGGTRHDSESYSWTARVTNNFIFGRNFSMQLSGNYRSPTVMLQGKIEAMYSADFGMRYGVLNNNGNITLRVSDIFNTQKFELYSYGENFEMNQMHKRRSRMIFLGFSYRIHDYRRDRDRHEREDMEPMDDFDGF